MNQTVGRYEVTGKREYRGHAPGTFFEARLEPGPERRAVDRGDIRLLERITPDIPPGAFTFPDGWLPAEPTAHQPRRPERAPLS